MAQITWMTLAVPGNGELDVLLMAQSLREFGGTLADTPVWLLVPETLNHFSAETRTQLDGLQVEIKPFEIDPAVLKFPFAAKISAAAHAENLAASQTDFLAWLDRDNLILREPGEFRLPKGKYLGYRPVHHKLIGLDWNTPPDSFWTLVYQFCQVPAGRDFPMTTHTGEVIRPYFNAGTYVLRPEAGLLAHWERAFTACFLLPEFQAFYEVQPVYRVFLHQAIWTGVVLNALEPAEMQLLSPKINYPLHLHNSIPENLRPAAIADLTTLRYEDVFSQPDWQANIPLDAPLKSWLEKQPLLQNPPA